MLVRWDPFSEIDTLQRSVNRLFDEAVAGRRGRQDSADALWSPAVNTYEDSEAFVLACDLPGIDQNEVKVNLDNNVLTVSGSRKLDNEDKRENYQRVESFFGTFSRSFSLPATVDTDRVEAHMDKGVLRIRLPKREETKPRQIEIANQ